MTSTSARFLIEDSNLRWSSYTNNDDARRNSTSYSNEDSDVEVTSDCSEHSDDIYVYEIDLDGNNSNAYPIYEQQHEDDDYPDTDEEEIQDDAVEFIPVDIQMADDSSASTTAVELDVADPLLGLTPSECLQHLHTAVGLCPPHSSCEALNVFEWGAKAILRVVNDAYLAGGNPFEEGGIVYTEAVPGILELDAIRIENEDDFDDMCYKLNEALTYVWEESRKLPKWSTRAVVELDSWAPAVAPTKSRRRPDKRCERRYLGVDCVAQRTRSRSSRKLSNRMVSGRVTRSMVRAGMAELVAGIE
eukprot:jgi/Undpi1/13181/HiC_scaffold_8.g02843.m1